MLKKLRTFLVALLLVPALYSNAHAFTTASDGALSNATAFTTASDGALNPARSEGWCWIYFMGMWMPVPC
jgi:hypothetical protein